MHNHCSDNVEPYPKDNSEFALHCYLLRGSTDIIFSKCYFVESNITNGRKHVSICSIHSNLNFNHLANVLSSAQFQWETVDQSKAYWTTRAVRFVTAFRSDTGGLASLVRRSGFVAIGFRFGRDVRLVHTIKSEDLTPLLRIWSFRIKFEDLTPFLRNWSFGIKAVPNDQCGSVRKVLSVRHRRPRFARPPIGVRRDRLSIRTGR